jgi:hypothetical protein
MGEKSLPPPECARENIRPTHPVPFTAGTQISFEWADKIVQQLCYWNILFDLQTLAKQPKPIITVRTKAIPPRDIPVLQLSDGQRYTILLTIAMLAESNVPLVIDQPEDDLDNAFISSSIVSTLRAIKERRQVIVVTHNANIAVLGDSELILPMHRESDSGKTKDRGSIDSRAIIRLRDCHLRQVTDLREKISRKDALKSLKVLKAAGSSAIEMSEAKAPEPPAVS